MKKPLLTIVLLLQAVYPIFAQNNNNFDGFRNDILNDYKGFREQVLNDYAKYLENIWEEFNIFRGEERNKTPKPKVAPVIEVPIDSSPVEIPTPDIPTPTIPIVEDLPLLPNPVYPTYNTLNIDFVGMTFSLPRLKVFHSESKDETDIVKAWQFYQKNGCKDVIPTFKAIIAEKGLNDWFIFQVIRKYVNTLIGKGFNTDRIALEHFLLVHWGFDVRIARTDKQYVLLVPFLQTVYERRYIVLNGKKYYMFIDEVDRVDEETPSLYTCQIPDNLDLGNPMNLRIMHDVQVTKGNTKHRKLSDGFITIEGDVNVLLMEMLRHYPQMNVSEYARSSINSLFRKTILEQMESQIKGLSQRDAANQLIHFVQYAFDYATDDEQHGYEKAYFFEENFYYPKNDCEDRAIFYAFLVRNLLGLDVHLIEYPGHECTAVNFSDESITGDGYVYEGKKFIICDPTYIGASIGMCMPDYKNIRPIIDLWY